MKAAIENEEGNEGRFMMTKINKTRLNNFNQFQESMTEPDMLSKSRRSDHSVPRSRTKDQTSVVDIISKHSI
jgi:hypothetical protein